jgi:hypothetical protein
MRNSTSTDGSRYQSFCSPDGKRRLTRMSRTVRATRNAASRRASSRVFGTKGLSREGMESANVFRVTLAYPRFEASAEHHDHDEPWRFVRSLRNERGDERA